MRKILFILLLAPFALKSQTVNTFRDSTWFKRGVRFDSTLVFSKGAGVGKVWTSNANGTGSWQTFSSAGVTQGALDDSISAVRAIRKVDTIYKNLDSIVFKINDIRYSVLDSTGGGGSTTLFPNGYNFITEDYVLQASDEGKLIIALSETPIHITVPTGSDVFTNKVIGIAIVSRGDFEIQPGVAVTPLHQTNDGLGIGDLRCETVICQTAAGDGINGLSVLSTSVINDNGSYKTMLRYLYDKSQDAIPLSGTEVGSPVTGNIFIEPDNGYGIISQYDSNTTLKLTFAEDIAMSALGDAGLQQLSINPTGIFINSSSGSGNGITGLYDYTANITDLDYTQKKYVDTRISDTAAQIRSEMPDVSNFATITNLADTSSVLRGLITSSIPTFTLSKNATRDSIVTTYNGTRSAVKDSSIVMPTFSFGRNASLDSIYAIYNGTRYAAKDSFSSISATSTTTFTNKRITARVDSTTSSATPTINTDNVDTYKLTAQAADISSFTTNLTGTPTDDQILHIVIIPTATRAITWGSKFESSTVTLPTTTVSTNRLDVYFIWNTATSKWRCGGVW